MPRTLELTDGTTTVNLLNTTAGFQLAKGGYQTSGPPQRASYSMTPLVDGQALRHLGYDNLVETYRVSLTGTSHDNAASILQSLYKLIQNARDYHVADWQTTPVYLKSQTAGETNARFALVFTVQISSLSDVFAVPFDPGNYLEEIVLLVEREPFWKSNAPATLPAALSIQQPQAPVAADEMVIPNCKEKDHVISHIFTFDDSAATFSANLIDSTAFNYFPSPAGLNDILYIGASTGPFRDVVFFIGTFRTGTATLVWEYWNGTAWGVLSETANFTDGTDKFLGAGGAPATGNHYVKILKPTGWVFNTVNLSEAHWIRCRISAFTSMGVPAQSTRKVYNALNPYLAVTATALKGDVDALARILLNNKSEAVASETMGIMSVIVGMKSRGITGNAFVSHLNFGDGNTSNDNAYSVAAQTDTGLTTDIFSPGERRMTCTFATDQTLVRRATFEIVAGFGAAYVGTYRAFLRCKQLTGAVGDVKVQLQATLGQAAFGAAGSSFEGQLKALREVFSAGSLEEKTEVVDLGLITIPFVERSRGLTTTQAVLITDISFAIFASAASATPDLHLIDLVLIPVDEMVIAVESPDVIGSIDYSIQKDNAVIVDGGLTGVGAQYVPFFWELNQVQSSWYLTTPPPAFPPDKAFNLYFLFLDQSPPAASLRSTIGQGCVVQMWAHQRWAQLRGAE